MTWPTVAVSTTHMDSALDNPGNARADIKDAVDKLNQIMAHASAYIQTLLDDADAAAARTTLGAAASGSNTDITSLGAVTGVSAASGDRSTKLATTAAAGENAPAGMVAAFAMNTAPAGWLKANGAAVSRTTYANLFTAIGTTFGAGDGSTTFNLPDMRGEFARGWDDGRGVDSGRVFGSAQSDELESHTHEIIGSNTAGAGGNLFVHPVTVLSTYTGDTQSTGGTETRPRNIALLYCIRY